jgi:hypothetical protein
MLATAPGRHVPSRKRWWLAASRRWQAQRSYLPNGLALRQCAVCAVVHATGPCSELAAHLRREFAMPMQLMLTNFKGKVSEDTLRLWHSACTDAEAAAASAADNAARQREKWREIADRSGLAKLARELEHPAPPVTTVRSERDTRVRATQSFSGEFENLPCYGRPGDVFLVAKAHAKALVKSGVVEYVSDDVPLGQASAPR